MNLVISRIDPTYYYKYLTMKFKIDLNPFPISLIVQDSNDLDFGCAALVEPINKVLCSMKMLISPDTLQLAKSKDLQSRIHAIAVISHECVHVVQNLNEFLNETLSDETAAYMVETLVEKISLKIF